MAKQQQPSLKVEGEPLVAPATEIVADLTLGDDGPPSKRSSGTVEADDDLDWTVPESEGGPTEDQRLKAYAELVGNDGLSDSEARGTVWPEPESAVEPAPAAEPVAEPEPEVKADEPEPAAPAADAVTFVCDQWAGVSIYGTGIKFEKHRFTTSDPRQIARLDAWEHARREG